MIGTIREASAKIAALATRVEKLLGAPPYLVAARFSRKYIDANRIEAEAIESPQAKPVYDAYHEQIRQFRTVAALLEKHGPDALIGPKSVFGAVEAKGLEALATAILGSDHLVWDETSLDGELVAEVLWDWSSPDSDAGLTTETIALHKKLLLNPPKPKLTSQN